MPAIFYQIFIFPPNDSPLKAMKNVIKMKIQNFEYLENEKSFLDKIKKPFFIVLEGLSFGEK